MREKHTKVIWRYLASLCDYYNKTVDVLISIDRKQKKNGSLPLKYKVIQTCKNYDRRFQQPIKFILSYEICYKAIYLKF